MNRDVGRRRPWGDTVMRMLTLAAAAVIIAALAGLFSLTRPQTSLCETTTNHRPIPCGEH